MTLKYSSIVFNKVTVFEAYKMFLNKGIYTTRKHYHRELRKVPDEGVFAHIKPSYELLLKTLSDIADNSDDDPHLEQRTVGGGPVCNGESWGTFVDYFPKGSFYADMFNKIIDDTAFGIQGKIDPEKRYYDEPEYISYPDQRR